MGGVLAMDRRNFVLGAGAAAGCATAPARYDAAAGSGGIAAAIEAAPGDRPWRILVPAGRWREKLIVAKPNVTLIGESRTAAVLTYDDAARTPGPDGRPIGTSGSFSVAVRAPNFAARNLTIENAFDYDGAARAAASGDQQAAGGMQAVALMLGEGADCASFENCDILGHQDTLFANAGRALFRNCRIAGTVDFIFGGARAYFDRCEIVSRARPDASDRAGWIAAPSTQASQDYGLVFESCRLMRESGVPDWSVGLARFWRPTRTWADGRRYGDPNAVGQVAFLRCWMDAHIIPQGFDPMGYNNQAGGRSLLTPEETRPGEFASSGPGAAPRGFQLTAEQARRFTQTLVLDGWRPAQS